VNAVVLAGGPPDAVAALAPGAVNKAFVPIDGMTLVERTLRALRAVPRIEQLVVVAPEAAHDDAALALAGELRADGPRMLDSLRSGLAGLAPDELVLVVASDLPVLTQAAVDEFIDLLGARELDVAYGCLERRYHDARYPAVPHTWARMRDGSFCGAGISALRPRALESLAAMMDRLGAARKSPLRLAGIFGWDVLLKFALGRLSIAEAESRAGAILQVRAGAIRCTHPEIAINVDRPGDVALAESLVRP
jgi:molybdopterin-guanine dinucleotide biosynthesis protein A